METSCRRSEVTGADLQAADEMVASRIAEPGAGRPHI